MAQMACETPAICKSSMHKLPSPLSMSEEPKVTSRNVRVNSLAELSSFQALPAKMPVAATMAAPIDRITCAVCQQEVDCQSTSAAKGYAAALLGASWLLQMPSCA